MTFGSSLLLYLNADVPKIVSQYSSTLAPIAVDAVSKLVTPTSSNVDLRDIRIVKKIGGTIEDTELVEGVVLNQDVVVAAGGPTRMEKAKIAIVQFQLSPPKPDVRKSKLINTDGIFRLFFRWITLSLSTITVLWTR
jgi:chaperonin GroEL (HSP60 family)